MIWPKQKYKFDTETLSFVKEKIPRRKRLLQITSTLLTVNLIAFLLVFIMDSFIGSPSTYIQQNTNADYTAKYRELNQRVDYLTHQLQTLNYSNDQIYRGILELDSLSLELRSAGVGGSDPYTVSLQNEPAELISIRNKISTLKRQVIIQQESYEEIFASAIEKSRLINHYPAISPLKMTDYIWISSRFGVRTDPFTHFRKSHSGLDFVGPRNTEIFATADGIVTLVKHSRKGYGNEIVIDHQFGHETRYAHLNKILVKDGQRVERGQLIGLMGSTGRSTGTHLHYEVRYNKRPVNPLFFFSDNLSPDEFEQLAKRTD